MKTSYSNLSSLSTQTSYANNGKLTVLGRTFQKTINSQPVYGPQLTQWLDLFQTYSLYPQDAYYNPNTGHLFILSSTATALTAVNMYVQLFNFSAATSWVPSYVGKINLNFGNSAASTPTVKGFSVYESGGLITPVVTITGSVAIEGGTYIAYNLTTASFTVGGNTAYIASGPGQAGYMYLLQDPTALGAAHVATTAWGQALPQFSSVSSVNTQVWQANGTFALPVMYSWNLATAPSVAGTVTNAVNSLTGGYTTATNGVSTVCYLSMPTSALYYTTFTISALSSAITSGATYTTGGVTFTAVLSYTAGSLGIVFTSTSSSQIASSGTLTLASGTGPATIAYTGISQQYLFSGYALGAGADPIVLMAGTAAVPTGFTAWVANTLQTTSNVYFTRDVQLVYTFTTSAITSAITAGATYNYVGTTGNVTLTVSNTTAINATTVLGNTTNGATIPASGTLALASGTGPATITFTAQTSALYFNAATTSGGAAVAATSTNSGFTLMRAFGTSANAFSLKTSSLTAITGGALVNNTMNYCKPISSPANTTLQGLDCVSFQSSTALYLFKISDLNYLSTTWPSLNAAGIANTGTGLDVTAITTTFGEYSGQGLSGDIDNFIYVTNGSTFIAKPYKVPGSALTAVFGGTTDTYYAGQNPVTIQSGLATVTQLHVSGGWLFTASTTTGQAGLVIMDIGSDSTFGYSGLILPVSSTLSGSTLKLINTLEQLFDYTDSMNFWIRNGATSSDSNFTSGTLPVGSPTTNGAVSNGWTCIKVSQDLSSITFGPYFQLCVTFDILTLLANTPAQLYDLLFAYLSPAEQSDYWAVDNDNTTQGTSTPSYVSWRLQQTYSATVPTMYARVYDTSGNLLFSANTSSNPTSFQYSTNDGATWNNLGTIPNTVDTRVRVLVTPTPSVVAQPSLRES
jgi:hypothetical protein